jgi:hypothetical protein
MWCCLVCTALVLQLYESTGRVTVPRGSGKAALSQEVVNKKTQKVKATFPRGSGEAALSQEVVDKKTQKKVKVGCG